MNLRGRGQGVLVPQESSLSIPCISVPLDPTLQCLSPPHEHWLFAVVVLLALVVVVVSSLSSPGLHPPPDMVIVALLPPSLLPIFTPQAVARSSSWGCGCNGGPHCPGGAVMVEVFTALPVPHCSLSSCIGPIVPFPPHKWGLWPCCMVWVLCMRHLVPMPLIVVVSLVIPVISWS